MVNANFWYRFESGRRPWWHSRKARQPMWCSEEFWLRFVTKTALLTPLLDDPLHSRRMNGLIIQRNMSSSPRMSSMISDYKVSALRLHISSVASMPRRTLWTYWPGGITRPPWPMLIVFKLKTLPTIHTDPLLWPNGSVAWKQYFGTDVPIFLRWLLPEAVLHTGCFVICQEW